MDASGLVPSLIGAPLAGHDGVACGTVEDLLVDAATHRPVWLVVRLSVPGAPRTLVPAERMAGRRDAVVVPFASDLIRSAPVALGGAGAGSREHHARLCRHFGVRLPGATWTHDVRAVHGALAPEPAAAPAPALAAVS